MATFFITPRCPFEILSAIFTICVEDFITTKQKSRKAQYARPAGWSEDMTALPQALTIVCRSWRDVTLATPRLWAAFHFGEFNFSGRLDGFKADDLVTQQRIHTVRRWLERSRLAPLTVVLKYFNPESRGLTSAEEYLQSIYSLFCDHSSHWYDMELSWTCQKSPHLEIPMLSFPKLFRLSCHFNVGIVNPNLHPTLMFQGGHQYIGNKLNFSDAPNLREVLVDTLTIGLIDFRLPWSQLRSLAFLGQNETRNDEVFVADCLTVLSQCGNLTDLKIYDGDRACSSYRPTIYTPRTTQIVTLPLLKHFIFTTEDRRMNHGVLPYLHLPVLETLILSLLDTDVFDSIVQSLATAHSPLRMLHIEDGMGYDYARFPESGDFLAAFPKITSLTTNAHNLLSELHPHFHPTSGQLVPAPLPELQELCLTSWSYFYDKWLWEQLLDFVSSRWSNETRASISKFRRLRLQGSASGIEGPVDEIREYLKKFVDRGLELELYEVGDLESTGGMESAVWEAAGARWPCEL